MNSRFAEDLTLTERNINLGFAFTREILDDPSLLDAIPDGVTLVLIPSDDATLTDANLKMAVAEVRKGRDVFIRHMRPSEQ